MRSPPLRHRRRDGGWLVLEASLVLALLGLGLTLRVVRTLAVHRSRVRLHRRVTAYFLVRGFEVELPLYREPPRDRDRPVSSLYGVRADRRALGNPGGLRGSLRGLRVRTRQVDEGVVVEVAGPGFRERRTLPAPLWGRP